MRRGDSMKNYKPDELYELMIDLMQVGRFEEVVDIARPIIDNLKLYELNQSIMNIIYTVAISYFQIGDFQKAFQLLSHYEKMCKNTDSIENLLNLKNAFFLLYRYIGKSDLAIPYLKQGIEIANQISPTLAVVKIYNHLSYCYLEQERYEEALQFAENALQNYEAIATRDKLTYYMILIQLSLAYMGLRNFENAKSILDTVLEKVENDRFESEKAQCYKALSIWYKQQGYYIEALEVIEKAIVGISSKKQPHILKDLYEVQMDIFEILEMWEHAFRVQKEYLQALKEIDLYAVSYELVNMEMNHQIAEMNDKVYRDPLTGVYNRQYLVNTVNTWLERRESEEIYCCVFDIDRFKHINDTYGHLVGDKVIKIVAQTIHKISCETENQFVARYGGDEFVLMLRHGQKEQIKFIVHMIAGGIYNIKVKHEGQVIRVTPSIGISSIHCCENCTFEELFEQADRAMYRVKQNGGNNFSFVDKEKV